MTHTVDELKDMLKKYARTELLSLGELAAHLKMSEDYLHDLIRQGKIKAFKVGEYWFMEEKWLNDFRLKLKQDLTLHADNHELIAERRVRWVKGLPARRRIWPKLSLPRLSLPRLTLPQLEQTAWVAAYAFFLALAIIGLGFTFLPLADLGQRRQELAGNFLIATYRVYNFPVATLSHLQKKNINDENLTGVLYSLIGQSQPGKVLGQFESKPIGK
jgi:AraC-like DNA-binding protein